MTTELCGLKVNDRIKAPLPFSGNATIIGFRYQTSRHTGRTYMAADYITDDGKAAYDAIEKLLPLRLDVSGVAKQMKRKEYLVYIRSQWEIARAVKNSVTGIEQWERRDGSYICDTGKETAAQPLPIKPARKE